MPPPDVPPTSSASTIMKVDLNPLMATSSLDVCNVQPRTPTLPSTSTKIFVASSTKPKIQHMGVRNPRAYWQLVTLTIKQRSYHLRRGVVLQYGTTPAPQGARPLSALSKPLSSPASIHMSVSFFVVNKVPLHVRVACLHRNPRDGALLFGSALYLRLLTPLVDIIFHILRPSRRMTTPTTHHHMLSFLRLVQSTMPLHEQSRNGFLFCFTVLLAAISMANVM